MQTTFPYIENQEKTTTSKYQKTKDCKQLSIKHEH